jgi:AraC-like DNA-binding protein
MNDIYEQLNLLLAAEDTFVPEVLTGYRQVTIPWHMPQRSLPEHLIYFICNNHVSATINTEQVELGPGSMLWLMPYTPHTFTSTNMSLPPSLYHFRFRLDNPSQSCPQNKWLNGSDMEDSVHLASMYHQCRDISPPDVNRRVRNILSLLLSDLRNSQSAQANKRPQGFNRQTTCRIIEYVRKHIKSRPTPGDLAKHVQLSEDYFSRMFKLTFGVSARQWLVRQRIMATAEDLQSSGKSISEVAYEYGYDDIFFFSRQFKQIMGKSPRNWLNQH